MTFDDVWDNVDLETEMAVSNGKPPPSTNTEGIPYKTWKSHNFIGVLKEKLTTNGWRYLKFEVLNSTTPEAVVELSYEIPLGGGHSFEVTS